MTEKNGVGTKKGECRGKCNFDIEKAAPEALPPKHACETQHLWATRKEAWQRSLAGMVVKCATGFGKGYRPVFQPMPMLCIRGVL